MNNSGFSLLWSKILHSSLWVKESKETRLVWITLLALRNSQGVVQSSVVGLADAAKVSVDECREALKVLSAPDADDTSGVENGCRIRQITGGWQIVNHDLYRFSTEAKREFWRNQQAEYRARKQWPKASNGTDLSIKEVVNEKVRKDPITRSDSYRVRKQRNPDKKTAAAEYDIP